MKIYHHNGHYRTQLYDHIEHLFKIFAYYRAYYLFDKYQMSRAAYRQPFGYTLNYTEYNGL